MSSPTRRSLAAGGAALLLAAGLGVAAAAPAQAGASCFDQSVQLSVEESRLAATLPDNDNPNVPQAQPFSQEMVDGGGLGDLAPALMRDLCHTSTPAQASGLVTRTGERLWRAAVDRAQRRGGVRGSLPTSDDRPLYWARLQATAALRRWTPAFTLSAGDRASLITTFDRAARGMFDIRFPAGGNTKRIIVSGFDPFTFDGGQTGPAPGSVGNNIRHGNPSGATALSLDGARFRTADGKTAAIETYLLPVNYTEFTAGYLEDTVGPYLRSLSASITVSQAVDSVFDLEQWNGRYHGVSPGNDLSQPCPTRSGVPQLAVNNHGCNIEVVPRWGGPAGFDLNNPPQWTTSSLPIGAMIKANTGASVPRPPGDEWPDPSVAFGVVWHTNFTEFPDCNSTARVTRNDPPPVEFPPPTAPVPPDPGSCANNGGGGNYLSNESAYRNTLLRDRMGLSIPAGHIHTPDMQHFETAFKVTDPTFDAWRTAIVAQAQNLIHVVADES